MNQASGKVQMAKLARLFHRAAELQAELAENNVETAKVFDAFAEGETVDMRTGKLRPKYRKVELPTDITPEERAVAIDSLRANDMRRRNAR